MAEELGSLLKRSRIAAGLTQEELAEKAAVSARTISDVERGLRSRVYRDTARRLADALGLADVARAAFATASRGRRLEEPPSRLPIPPTRLIGRERELETVVAELERPDARLVTITGPGGIGKTRLALEAARAAGSADGAVFVQLANTSEPERVIPEIALAVGVSGAKEPTIVAIAERVGDSRLLILLDTCEHVLAAAADVSALLGACAGLVILATSREAWRIRGEKEVALPTLTVPDAATMERVVDAPATALFVERAIAVRPQLTIDDRSAALIVDICRKVNGLPLAIELAAARAKHVSLDELREQLGHRLDVLVGGARDLPQRQQTMRDTVAWSYDSLDANEEQVFRGLCVFSGGWTLDAASAVCGTNALAGVSALVDKSLVVRADDEEPRYSMLDVVREYGLELGPPAGAEDRHLAHFLSLAEAAEPELGRGSQREWLQRLVREHDNLRTALRLSVAHGDADTTLRLGGAIWRFWLLHGDLSEGRRWLAAGLSLRPPARPEWRAKGLWGSAWLAYHQGDYGEAERCGEEMVALAEPAGDPVAMRNALTIRGIVAMAYGRLDDAVAAMERCVELLADREPDWLLATSLLNLGTATAHAGDARALPVLQRVHDLYTELGDEHYAARALVYSGYASLRRNEDASAFFRRSLVAFWELDDMWGTTEALEGCAATAAVAGDFERAATISGAADGLRKRINSQPFAADQAALRPILDTARASIETTRWEQAWQEGRTMNADEAVDYALR